jgi:hypothetical protein
MTDTDRSRDLFWDRNKPKALLKSQEYEHPGRAACEVINEVFHISENPSEVEFREHLGNTYSTTIVAAEAYEQEVIEEFFEVVSELTGVGIGVTKITNLDADYLGDNRQYRVDIQYEEDSNSGILDRYL